MPICPNGIPLFFPISAKNLTDRGRIQCRELLLGDAAAESATVNLGEGDRGVRWQGDVSAPERCALSRVRHGHARPSIVDAGYNSVALSVGGRLEPLLSGPRVICDRSSYCTLRGKPCPINSWLHRQLILQV